VPSAGGVSRNWRSNGKDVVLTERNPYTELTILQRRYVDARLQGLGITAAARAAGANVKNPGNIDSLEKNPKVRAAMRWAIKESGQRAEELTKNDVMTGLLDAVDAAATASELVMAWRELGKLIGAYEPEKKILEIHEYKAEDLKMLSDKELAQLAGDKFADAIDAEFEELSAK
jgi:hypothetical protein